MSSLNLPAALEDSSGVDVPESVRQKAVNIKQEGGLDDLKKIIGSLPDMLQRNKDILDEVSLHTELLVKSDKFMGCSDS